MFRCELCSCVVPPRTRARRVVVATRARRYPFRREANIHRWLEMKNGRPKHKEDYPDNPGGVGLETVREVKVCPACAERHRAT
jgi:hypothetical protein